MSREEQRQARCIHREPAAGVPGGEAHEGEGEGERETEGGGFAERERPGPREQSRQDEAERGARGKVREQTAAVGEDGVHGL